MPALKYLSRFDDRELPVPATFYDHYENRSSAAKEQEMEIASHMRDAWDFKIRPDEPDLSQWTDKGYAWHYGKLMTEEQKKIWDAYYDPLNERYKYSKLTEKERAEWKYQRYIKDYLRCVLSIDEGVGRILDLLDKLELTNHTLVVYTSDQGFYLGEHGWFDKRFMYEESFRTPLLMRWPEGIPAGIEDTNLVQNLDFAPTFLDVAGLRVPGDMQGVSLKPLWSGDKEPDWRTGLYYHYYEYPAEHKVKRHYGIRTTRYKLIHFYYDIDAWEFYDLEKDPTELHNQINHPEYQEVIYKLKNELKELQIFYKDSIR
jgi:arylsulfatase A-like enzyme